MFIFTVSAVDIAILRQHGGAEFEQARVDQGKAVVYVGEGGFGDGSGGFMPKGDHG
jgi:hypothetical protein